MKAISIIRSRGQLTIPDSIRKVLQWVSPMSAISISVVKTDEIVIKPHKVETNWDLLWKKIQASRSLTSKKSISASELIAQDRSSH